MTTATPPLQRRAHCVPANMSHKRKNVSREFIEDSDDSADTGTPKTKKAKASRATATASAGSDDEMIQLSAKRFVNVRMFNGRQLIDIREYYDDDAGERKPGRKGISLTLEQWEKLKTAIPAIDEKIHGT